MEKLRQEYKKLIGKKAPLKFTKTTIQKYTNWHTQAKEQGVNWRKLEQQLLNEKNYSNRGLNGTFKDGTKLLRHWNGTTYAVITQGNQFLYNNNIYKSLSKIAREITGTNWNGKLFFKVGG